MQTQFEIVTWKIRGIRPLMQTNWRNMMELDTGTSDTVTTRKKHRDPPFVEAQKQLYEGDDGFWHPSLAFWRALNDNCTGRKIGDTAASTMIPRVVMPLDDEEFVLYDPDTLDDAQPKKLPADGWVMRSDRVVNEKKGALIVHRPLWRRWGGFLSYEVEMDTVKHLDPLTEILNIAGRYGVGAGRMCLNQKTKKWGGLGLGKFTAELR